ncbi:FtsK/SpoIIIE domain-containing protein [Aquipuribacter sp. SD81]|uniref:FtsK/SpoIIIE domain-containing protein n=1 Tax=Aquipuribacter sp. SD81 TaxID=3127703 RepID=UPI003019787F
MRAQVSVVDPGGGTVRDVVLDTDPDVTVAAVAAALAGTEPGAAPTLWVRGRPLDGQEPVGSSAVVDGALVGLGSPVDSDAGEPLGLVELRVVGGPGAGVVRRLTAGTADVGGGPAVLLRLPGAPDAVLATLDVAVTGEVTVAPGDGTGAVVLEGEPVTTPRTWSRGGVLRVGDSLVQLCAVDEPDAALHPSDDGAGLDYNRPPRLLPPERQTVYRLPRRPTAPHRRPLPVVAALVPLVLACVMAFAFDRLFFLVFGVMTPVMLVANFFYERRTGRARYRTELKAYERRRGEVEADAREALVLERDARRHEAPDPATLLLTAVGPRSRLWERRRGDPDHLLLRIGTADLPSDVVVEDPEQHEHRRKVAETAPDVPVTVPLGERGVVGVAGDGAQVRLLAGWCVGQLAVLQSPSDVCLVVLTDPAGAPSWDWVRWLPHARPSLGQDALSLLGTDTETCARRVAELTALVAARRAASRGRQGMSEPPDVVVVLDGARRLRSLPGVVQLLRDGPEVGVRFLCLDADRRFLPEECTAVVALHPGPDGATVVHLAQQRSDDVTDARPDLVPTTWPARVARALAPLRDVGDDDDAALPPAARLLDVLGLPQPAGEAVAARWLLGGATTEAVLGVSLDGPFALDLRRDGPHALVAGTTGSGKSELLQTLVASLAVANRPDAMTFVLVDYKGGAAFKDCVDLPHTVGMVTDLDTHLVARALASLGAELRRREHVLAAAGAKDIEDHADLARRDGLAPLPRLAIVIDEFASLARELPDFVSGLVNIAQRGRSLGIHLVLATQRPSGVVSPEIRANTNLRIALRVTDAGESTDVLDAPDAARITKSTPGRAFVRLGAGSIVPFQAGRVGGRWPGRDPRGGAVRAPWVTSVPTERLGHPEPRRPAAPGGGGDVETTDLSVLVAAVRAAAARVAVPAPHRPWLEALHGVVTLEQVARLAGSAEVLPGAPAAAYAVADLPSQQARRLLGVDLATFQHLYVVGSPRSGRSQTLRTLAGALAAAHPVADVHLYGLDCGNGALLPLTRLPHCGAVVTRTQEERARRLLLKLAAEVQRRGELLAAGGFADVGEQRRAAAPEERLPHVVLLVDRWEGFVGGLGDADGGRLTEVVQQLLREGAGVGVHLVVAGDRQLLSTRMATLVEDKLLLRLAERNDYSMAGIVPRTLPEDIAPGRAFLSESGTEAQVAVLTDDLSGAAQADALARIGAAARERDRGTPRTQRPFRVDTLPATLDFAAARALRDEDETSPLWAMVGVGGDELVALGPDLGDVPTFVVAGPPKSGRSGVLLSMARSVLAQGGEVVVLAPRASPLRDLAGTAGVRGVLIDAEPTADELEGLLTGGGPVALVVDDGELVKDMPAADWLRAWLRTAADGAGALVLGGTLGEVAAGFSGWQVDVKRARRGALLCPQSPLDGDTVGVRLPRSLVGQPVQPGRALLHLGDGELVTVQVPVP